jgi:hypothetical protein
MIVSSVGGKMERQIYYKQLVGYLVEKHYGVEIDPSKHTEAPLPNVRIDMFFEIPKKQLRKPISPSPFPFLAEVNLVHIKGVNDKLTKNDVRQYLGELYVICESTLGKGKSVSLTIVAAEEVKSVQDELWFDIFPTEFPWIDGLDVGAEAYLFVLERLSKEHKHYSYFLPFQPLKVLHDNKDKIVEIAKRAESEPDYALVLFWLTKLQPEFCKKELNMKLINYEEVARELCPQAWQRLEEAECKALSAECKAKRDALLNILTTRFGKISSEIQGKIGMVDSIETLDSLISKAVQCPSLETFQAYIC